MLHNVVLSIYAYVWWFIMLSWPSIPDIWSLDANVSYSLVFALFNMAEKKSLDSTATHELINVHNNTWSLKGASVCRTQ